MSSWIVTLFRRAQDERPSEFGGVISADTADEAHELAVAQNPGWAVVGVQRILDPLEQAERDDPTAFLGGETEKCKPDRRH